jgi:membrane-bound lytic murein transglycosylase D
MSIKPLFYASILFAGIYGIHYSQALDTKDALTEGKPVYIFEYNTPPQKVTPVPMPQKITFAGEPVPLDKPEVKEALERELMVNTFRHSNTIRLIKNIERWRNLIAENLRENNVPEDFLYLAVVESEFDNNAASPVGASGMWQIMEQTGKEYGLVINQDADMRRDPKQSTIAASKYLNAAYGSLNSWTLAAASYNVGIKGMKDRLETQKVTDYYDLHLNPETGRYIYRILALKIILENPETYGFIIPEGHRYNPYRFTTIKIDENISNLPDFAKKHQTTYKQLRILNPWLNNTTDFKLAADKKTTFEMRIPM